MMRVCDMTYVKINALIWQCNVLDQTICIPSCLPLFIGLTFELIVTSPVGVAFICPDAVAVLCIEQALVVLDASSTKPPVQLASYRTMKVGRPLQTL